MIGTRSSGIDRQRRWPGAPGSASAPAAAPGARRSPFRARRTRRLAGALLLAVLFGSQSLRPAGADEGTPSDDPLAVESLLLDAAAAGPRLVVVGERGRVLVSADGGESWKLARTPTRALLTAVHLHDERSGWAVGHDAVILRTRDGGESWQLVHRAPEEERPLLDVWFRDEHRGFAVGAYGYFLATEDGGDTWNARAISHDDYHLNALASAGAKRLYLAAEAGVAYRSDDDGETWVELSPPYAGSWFGALALDADTVVLTGLRGNLFRSDDAGETWVRLASGTTATLTGAVRLPSGAVLMTGLDGALLTSRDDGRSVALTSLPSRQGVSAAVPLADGGALIVGEFGARRLPPVE